MLQARLDTRHYLSSIASVDEFNSLLEACMLSDIEKRIARMRFINGWSISRIAAEVNYSERQVKRKLTRIYDVISWSLR